MCRVSRTQKYQSSGRTKLVELFGKALARQKRFVLMHKYEAYYGMTFNVTLY